MANALLIAGAAGYSAYAQNKAGKEQLKLANRNADNLEASANDAVDRGNEEAIALKRRAKGLRGKQRATLAGSGVDVGSGTALDLQEETSSLAEADASTIRRNAFKEAWGIKTSANYEREAGAYARKGARNNAIGTLLGGTGEAYRGYYSYDKPRIAAGG